MKKLSLIILIAFFSCKKEVVRGEQKLDSRLIAGRNEALLSFLNGDQLRAAARPQGGWFFTGTQSARNLTAFGASTTFVRPRFAKNSTMQAAWVAVEFNTLPDGRRPWGQYGISYASAFRSDLIVQDFFYLGNGLSGQFFPNQVLIPEIAYVPPIGSEIRWSIEKNSKPGVWNFCRNGQVIWEVDLPGTTHIIRVEVFCESQDTSIPKNFPTIEFKPALEIMNSDNSFYPFSPATVVQCNHGIRGTGFNAMQVGGGPANCLSTGTILWQ